MKRDNNDIAVHIEKAFFSDGIILPQRMNQWAKYFAITLPILPVLVSIGRQFNIEFLKGQAFHLSGTSLLTAFVFISTGIHLLLFVMNHVPMQKDAYAFVSLKKNHLTGQ